MSYALIRQLIIFKPRLLHILPGQVKEALRIARCIVLLRDASSLANIILLASYGNPFLNLQRRFDQR